MVTTEPIMVHRSNKPPQPSVPFEPYPDGTLYVLQAPEGDVWFIKTRDGWEDLEALQEQAIEEEANYETVS